MKYLKIISIFCIFCFMFTLSACSYNNYSNLSPGDEIENPTNDNKEDTDLDNNNERKIMRLNINNTIFEVMLENNSTANSFYNMLPKSIEMIELNGNEKYYYLNTSLPTNSSKMNTIYAGDIMLWGSNCIVIFYETFSSGYSYSKIGKITDIKNLKQCLGNGNVIVDFIK